MIKTIIVCSVHSIRFVKYVSFAEILFVKTSTRIVKYKLRVLKSNPALHFILNTGFLCSSLTVTTERQMLVVPGLLFFVRIFHCFQERLHFDVRGFKDFSQIKHRKKKMKAVFFAV